MVGLANGKQNAMEEQNGAWGRGREREKDRAANKEEEKIGKKAFLCDTKY